MSPFKVLGLDDEADLAVIKRAYARLLRTHRPDEDPHAFQRLHEAYASCLEHARWREWDAQAEVDAQGEAHGIPLPASQPGNEEVAQAIHDPADPPQAPGDAGDDASPASAFRLDAFLDEFLQMARVPHVDIDAWLRRHQDLYSVDNKAMVADALVWRLLDEPPLPTRVLAATLHHFELDVVNAPYQRMEGAIEQLRRDAAAADGDLSFMFDRDAIRPAPVRYERSWWWVVWVLIVVANAARHLIQS